MAIAEVEILEVDADKIAMDVVQIISIVDDKAYGNIKDDIEEVLRFYLKGKQLLTQAFDNKTKRKEIL